MSKQGAKYIGNYTTKEAHIESCFCVKSMKDVYNVQFTTLEDALNHGFDPCGHCLKGFKKQNTRKPGKDPDKDNWNTIWPFLGRFYIIYNYNYLIYPWNFKDGLALVERNKPLTLHAELYKVSSDMQLTPCSGQKIKFAYDTGIIEEKETDSNGIVNINSIIPDQKSGTDIYYRVYFPGNTAFPRNYPHKYVDKFEYTGFGVHILPVIYPFLTKDR